MDILDEIDAAIREKKSEWKYAPMREKSETDAIIDELLREFSPGRDSRSRQSVRTQAAVKERPEINEELRERREYERTVRNAEPVIQKEAAEKHSEREYNEYLSRRYSEAEYEDEEEYEEDYDEDYDNEDYDDEDEDYSEDGEGGNSDDDFESFMDSENDGESGDISDFRISAVLKILLKIIVLAAFGAFAVVGIINTAGMLKDRFAGNSQTSESENLKKELQSVIYPLIATETRDFAGAAELSDEELVNTGVWEIVINGNISVFKDENSADYILPQDQMNYIVTKLFGDEVEFNHTTSGMGETSVVYDKKKKEYIISENTDLYTFRPVVTDIDDAGDSYTVYADCYRITPSWNEGKSEPAKRVMVTLKKTSEYYNIVSLKSIPVE